MYACMYVCMYIYIYLICTYLYFCGLLLVFSVICMHQGVKRVTQFQFSVCMYGTCGRIDNKADFDFFDFDYKKHSFDLICKKKKKKKSLLTQIQTHCLRNKTYHNLRLSPSLIS